MGLVHTLGSGRCLVVRVLDSGLYGRGLVVRVLDSGVEGRGLSG